MDIENIKSLALNGDVHSMIELAEHYYDNADYDEAYFWYQKMYDNGIVQSIVTISILSKTFAKASIEFEGLNNEDTVTALKEAYLWAIKLKAHFENGDLQNINGSIVYDGLEEIAYNLALAYVIKKEYRSILDLSDGLSSTKGKTIYGLALRMSAHNETDTYKAYEYLIALENNIKYAMKEMDSSEEFIYTWALLILAEICRTGIKNISADTTRAFNILNFGLVYIKDAENRNSIREELNHYKKKLFGSYSYS